MVGLPPVGSSPLEGNVVVALEGAVVVGSLTQWQWDISTPVLPSTAPTTTPFTTGPIESDCDATSPPLVLILS